MSAWSRTAWRAAVRQAPEELLDLVAFQELRLGRGHALHWDRCDLLAHPSISGERVAMYSKRLWIAASRWLRVRMWLPRSSSR